MGAKINITKEQMIKSIDTSMGNIKEAIKVLKIGRDTYNKFIKKYELRPYLEEARIALRDKALECVEDNIVTDPHIAIKYLQFTKNLTSGVTVQGDNMIINVGKEVDREGLNEFLGDK